MQYHSHASDVDIEAVHVAVEPPAAAEVAQCRCYLLLLVVVVVVAADSVDDTPLLGEQSSMSLDCYHRRWSSC